MKKSILKRIFILGLLVFAFSCQPETPVVEGKVTLGQGVPATGIALESTVSTATFNLSAISFALIYGSSFIIFLISLVISLAISFFFCSSSRIDTNSSFTNLFIPLAKSPT